VSENFGEMFRRAWDAVDFEPKDLADFFLQWTRLFFVGNGGSAAIASHMANDFSKNGDYPALAFNDAASLTCLANDLGYDKVFSHPLEKHIRANDCLVAISSSGRSASIINAAHAAAQRCAGIVTLTGFDENNPLRELGQKNYHVPSHDYGIVETVHLGMLHATLGEFRNAR
jgi:D-sedoheptulose 7-phosphate isomerase